jgi:hypothetical protein
MMPSIDAKHSTMRLTRPAVIASAMLLSGACLTQRQTGQQDPFRPSPGAPPGTVPPPGQPPGQPAAGPPAPVEAPAPAEKALVIENGEERWIDAAKAEAEGYTLIDLSDDWTPFIFAKQLSQSGRLLNNRYRRVFIGLANDQLDEDGQPIPPGVKNYLELYGIFPSFSVIHSRFTADANRTCLDDTMRTALEGVEWVSYIAPAALRREELRVARLRRELEQARRQNRVRTLDALVEKVPSQAPKLKLVRKRAADKLAMTAVERRLACEGFLKPGSKHKPGLYDEPLREAVRLFQLKHMIYEANYLRRMTLDTMERDLLVNNQRSAIRTLRERVVAAAAILEDGSVPDSVLGPASNLAEDYTAIAARALGIDTPEGAQAFFERRQPNDFVHLRAAVKLPPRPAYYRPDMDLSIVIDRGDVWYDLPWDETGERQPQPRKKYPTFTLFVNHEGQKLPLIKWRTTIGGWRAEQASDGYEYYRYKGSEVGERIMKIVAAGPVWVVPASTPIRSLVKTKMIGNKRRQVVNYEELGPGFQSAYGLVAGYFVIPGPDGKRDIDNGIRAHGSAEYLSMYSPLGYSHGCHRLPNHLAIRLFSFILRHRKMRAIGDLYLNKERQFLYKDEVFELRLPSKGFGYVLDPPMTVEVLEGDIKGDLKEPIMGYVPKPGVTYPGPPPSLEGETPEERAGGGGGGEKPDPTKPPEEGPAAKL